jgi:hypothetical protein
MINEIWDYWTTKATRRSRKLGYLYHSVALKHRAKRCLNQWKPHLLSCQVEVQKAVGKAIEKFPERRSVVVLGSAEMHEVPLNVLKQAFEDIILIDVVQSKEMRLLAAQDKQIRLIERDVSGLPDKLEALTLEQIITMPELFDKPPALVISANLLSQIHRVPCQYLEKKGWSEEQVNHLALKVQRAHIEGLQKMDAVVLLYSDFRLEYLNSKDQITEVHDTVAPEILPHFNKRWIWDIAPIPEHSAELGLRMRVFSSFLK